MPTYSPSLEGYGLQGGAAHVLPRGELSHPAEDSPRVRPPVRLQNHMKGSVDIARQIATLLK